MNKHIELYKEILAHVTFLLEVYRLQNEKFNQYPTITNLIIDTEGTVDDYGTLLDLYNNDDNNDDDECLFCWCIAFTTNFRDRLDVSLEIRKDEPDKCYMYFDDDETTRLEADDFDNFISYLTGYGIKEMKLRNLKSSSSSLCK
jgi:hypothetical protein